MTQGFKVAFTLAAVALAGAGCDSTRTNATGGHATVMRLSDAESAAVVARLNAGEIETAELLLPLGAHSDVLRFAQTMIDEHAKLDGLLLATGVPEEPNGVGGAIDGDAAELRSMLGRATAGDADALYINSQAAMHRQVLLLVDCGVLPGTANGGFRQFVLEQVRPRVREHYEYAAQVADRLARPNGGGAGFAGVITVSTLANTCEEACDPQVGGGFSVGLREAACR